VQPFEGEQLVPARAKFEKVRAVNPKVITIATTAKVARRRLSSTVRIEALEIFYLT